MAASAEHFRHLFGPADSGAAYAMSNLDPALDRAEKGTRGRWEAGGGPGRR